MSASKTNDVTLFSNGIGHFRRVYKVPAAKPETAFSIPFKRDHIGDVAASLQVFGKVRLAKPPSFTPSNANATALNINASDALKSLLRSLSGSAVTVKMNDGNKDKCTLLGLDTTVTVVDGNEVQTDYIVIMSGGSVSQKPLAEVLNVHFEDEGVRTEIDKALKNNFQLIKPDSTLLDLSLTPLDGVDAEATVQYTIPVAAWKMRYAIRQDGDGFVLEGAAIIDNNTDEDWDNFKVSVVTGNPISFNTDIATVCVPNRKTVRLVDSHVLGNVNVSDGYPSDDAYSLQQYAAGEAQLEACMASAPRGGGIAKRAVALRSAGPKMSTANYAGFGMEAAESVQEDFLTAAESAGVDSKEVGDFSVFTSKEPITILARKSAVVPMFTVPLSKAGVVLLYKETNHQRRPYRAVKFKNETEFSLGKGKTVIYNSGLFSGECVLDTTKPGENRMLPHCLENGVKIVKEAKPVETRRASVKLSDGVGLVEEVYTAVTTYTVENKKDEKFKLAVEHTNALTGTGVIADFTGVELKEREKLVTNDGHRAYFELAAKQTVTLTVTETLVSSSRISLASHHNYSWLANNVINVGNPLAGDKLVQAAVKAQTKLDEALAELNEANTRRQELTQQGDRVRQNLAAAKDVGSTSTVAGWVTDLDTTEGEIRTLDKKTIPAIRKKITERQQAVGEELKKITVTWKA